MLVRERGNRNAGREATRKRVRVLRWRPTRASDGRKNFALLWMTGNAGPQSLASYFKIWSKRPECYHVASASGIGTEMWPHFRNADWNVTSASCIRTKLGHQLPLLRPKSDLSLWYWDRNVISAWRIGTEIRPQLANFIRSRLEPGGRSRENRSINRGRWKKGSTSCHLDWNNDN